MKVAYSGIKPARLVIPVGATVHFHNANLGGGVITLVGDEGSFESPPLPKGEGWHHTFEEAGSFSFHVKELSSVRGTVVVAPPR